MFECGCYCQGYEGNVARHAPRWIDGQSRVRQQYIDAEPVVVRVCTQPTLAVTICRAGRIFTAAEIQLLSGLLLHKPQALADADGVLVTLCAQLRHGAAAELQARAM